MQVHTLAYSLVIPQVQVLSGLGKKGPEEVEHPYSREFITVIMQSFTQGK